MRTLTVSMTANYVTAWIAPIVIIVVATLIGWVIERFAVRWVKRLARHANHRESLVARAMRAHITLWGLLLGVGIAYDNLLGVYNQAMAEHKPNPIGLPSLVFSPDNQKYIHDGLLALFVISLSFMLAGVITALIVNSSASASRPVVSLVTNVTRLVVLIVGFILVLAILGVSIAPYLATLGIAGLAVSLALQATLTDLVSGMLLLASRQLAVGEYIKLSTGEEGYISDITWRTTTIRQLSNNVVIVPNSKMTSLPVINYHANTQHSGVSVELGVSYGSDLEQVERVTIEVARDVMQTVKGGLPDFEPSVRFNTLGDYSIGLTVSMQAQEIGDQYLIRHEFIKRLRRRYQQEGISIPYPVQTVHVRESREPGTDGVGAPQASANSSDASSR
ncbi:MAG TPA: mechanosensitive ion channel family protein [Ktedonobacterales bacterium]|nr:mechanosensitive ion channel family protein [Ktedonobacterales bacterium]